MSRYHKAAIDGYLDLLKEATRKDLNTPDEDGMTPTLWAAYHGHIEALQLICSRGGDSNKSDIWGNTPLHHASANGHMQIVSFLVNFGANLFALDNDFHTPMDVAASRDHMDCVRFLDTAAAQQTGQNAKRVARLKEQATKDAERRVKLCERVKKRHQSKMDKMYRGGSVSEGSSLSGSGTLSSVNGEQFSKLNAADTNGSNSSTIKGTPQHKFGKKDKGTVSRQGDSNVIFVKQESSSQEKPGFVDVFSEQDEIQDDDDVERDLDDEGASQVKSIFERPGLGKMVFRRNFSMEMAMDPEDLPSGNTEDLGYLIRQELFETVDEGLEGLDKDSELPWNEEEIGLDEDEETSHLDSFLASIGLLDYGPVFTREHLDLDALMLCSDDDLKGIRIQLGPRKKILEASAHRKTVLEQPGVMKDTFL
ncbi:ankyrin repeat and SAM domain-containing protein 4B-like [Sinocyclocheilus anshuiensis]|uniref:Ankyrin repeat and SAM domain-containing protein 4B-like n=1 Tax=Sinocyclocheilus anshuiensis TaxID=1608454 RepID=A0A671SZM0_9TELE|nr:PREDICTED: ankyrin repeat and SAM domain-containing protein 4B-like [Sinocyclocheilus anshuiensis]